MLIVTLLTHLPAYATETEHDNNQITALFMYNFANYVGWPDNAFTSPTEPVKMCLFGNAPFASMLQPFDGTLIGNRKLSIYRSTELNNIINGCHILFVGEDKRSLLPNFFKQIRYVYVLSVSEQDDFLKKGGIISIVKTTDKLQFDINLSLANANRLTISSDLLSLARQVRQLDGKTKK